MKLALSCTARSVKKCYSSPAKLCRPLLADPWTKEEVRRRVNKLCATLRPVCLPQQIHAAQ
jgi:hypothetical protein